MNVWPFLTIFISLVLILFFRRIDKRTINFNKFKRYAEKLSADFNEYVQQKKEVLSGSLHDLENGLMKATQILARIEMADESMKSGLLNMKGEKSELDLIKLELEKLKRVKTDITEEIQSLVQNLPSLKKLSKRIKRMGIDLATHEKAIRNVSQSIPKIEEKVREKTQHALEEVRQSVVEDARGIFMPVVSEYRENIERMKTAHGEELDIFRKNAEGLLNTVVRRIDDLTGVIEELQTNLSSIEEEKLAAVEKRIESVENDIDVMHGRIEQNGKETIQIFLKRAEDEFARYVSKLDSSVAGLKQSIFQKIEERSKDLSTFITRLEGRANSLLDEVKKQAEKFGEELHLRVRSHESEADVQKERIIKEINDVANKNLLLIKPIVSEINAKLQGYKKEFKTIFVHMKTEFKNQNQAVQEVITSFRDEVSREKNELVGKIEERLLHTREQIKQLNDRVEEEVQSASESVGNDFVEKLKQYERSIADLDGKIGDLEIIANSGQKMIEERIESVYLNYEPEIEGKIQSLQRATEEAFVRERESAVQRVQEIINKSTSDLSSQEDKLNALLESMQDSISRSEDKIKIQEDALLANVNEVKIEARQELIRELENLKSLFKEEKERVVDWYKTELEGLQGGMGRISERLDRIHGEVEEKIEEVVAAVDGNVKRIEAGYMRNGEEMIEGTKKDLDNLTKQIETIRGSVRSVKNEVLQEVNETLTLHKKEVEKEYAGLKYSLEELKADKKKIESFFKSIEESINRSEESFKTRAADMLSHVNSAKAEAREEMLEELESLKNMFREEKEKIITAYSQDLDGVQGRIEEINGRVADISQLVDRRIDETLKGVEENIQEIETSYLRTGDEMIEGTKENLSELKDEIEAIRDTVRSVKDEVMQEVNEALSDHRDEVEKEYSKHRGIFAEIESHEAKINTLMHTIDVSIERSEDRLKSREADMIESVSEVKHEARQELMKELDELKEVFKAEKENVISKYNSDLEGLKGRVEEINERIDDISRIVEHRIEETLRSVEKNIREMETSYLKTGDEMLEKAKYSFSDMSDEMDRIRQSVRNMKDDVVNEVNDSLITYREEIDQVFVAHRSHVADKEKEIVELMDQITKDAIAEMERSHEEAAQKLGLFSEEADKVREKINKRIDEVEKRIASFEKESAVLKKAFKFKEQVEGDIEKLSEVLDQLKDDKKDVMALRKLIQNLKKDEGDISAKVRHLKGEKKMVADIAKNAEQAIGLISVVEEKIQFIEKEKEVLDTIESGISDLSNQFERLNRQASDLKSKESDIELSIETISKTKEFITNLEKRTEILKDNFNEIKGIEGDIKEKISKIEDKTAALGGNEKRIEELLERFKTMDALVQDIEARTKQLQSAREWIARTESRLTTLSADAQRLTEELKSYTEGAHVPQASEGGKRNDGRKPAVLSREAESKVKTVLTLFDQKWTIQEICKVTKMSRGEVELILELNNR
jgi:chromosome segregation ATPase